MSIHMSLLRLKIINLVSCKLAVPTNALNHLKYFPDIV